MARIRSGSVPGRVRRVAAVGADSKPLAERPQGRRNRCSAATAERPVPGAGRLGFRARRNTDSAGLPDSDSTGSPGSLGSAELGSAEPDLRPSRSGFADTCQRLAEYSLDGALALLGPE